MSDSILNTLHTLTHLSLTAALSGNTIIIPISAALSENTIIIPILWMSKLKLRELKSFAQIHRAYKNWSHNSNAVTVWL